MAQRSKLVNLDALIKRADFATEEGEEAIFESVSTISVRDFEALWVEYFVHSSSIRFLLSQE